MNDLQTAPDVEFTAMHAVYKALEPLDDDARSRVIEYIIARLEITTLTFIKPRAEQLEEDDEIADRDLEVEAGAPKYNSFAELYEATQPRTNADRALVAGYWLQVCNGAENFEGFSANKELKNLGHGVANITNAMDSLRSQKPALVLQIKKSGKSRQARKTYKITVAGIMAVEGMISG